MGNFLHRTTKQFHRSVPPTELPDLPLTNYISQPDLSAVTGQPSKYWTITGDVVTLMSAGEQATVDAAEASARRDQQVDKAIDDLESNLRQIVKLMLSEINILRANDGLADRTLAQLKTQLRGGYGS